MLFTAPRALVDIFESSFFITTIIVFIRTRRTYRKYKPAQKAQRFLYSQVLAKIQI